MLEIRAIKSVFKLFEQERRENDVTEAD